MGRGHLVHRMEAASWEYRMVPETIGLYTGHILHGNWWNYGCSVLAHLILWLSFYGLHTWLGPAKAGNK